MVLDILNEIKKPLNPYEIVKKSKNNTLDVSTVYRVLEVFKSLKIVHFIKDVQGFIPCQDYHCNNSNHCHHQFICTKCSSVEEFHIEDSSYIDALKDKLPGAKIEQHYLELSGLCSNCQS